jgi:magnesium transporter
MRVLEAIDDGALDDLRARGEFFWLDLVDPSRADVERLAERFGWHPVVVQDVCKFGLRAKLDRYGDDYLFIAFYGVDRGQGDEVRLVEVHLVVSGDYVVTARHPGARGLEDERARLSERHDAPEQFVVYAILDALTDSFFPLVEEFEDRLDRLEDEIIEQPGQEELERIFEAKRLVARLRRAVLPQRDLAASALDELADLPGLDAGTHDYFRDLYDHLLRIADQLDGYRDWLTSLTDLYLSTVSNRMNVVMKQLTIFATIFLPLTFVTGFFGQNFGWLVRHISSVGAFIVLGVGGLLVPCLGLYVLFRRQGYFRDV